MKKRLIMLISALIMIFSALSGCNEADTSPSASTEEIASSDTQNKIITAANAETDDLSKQTNADQDLGETKADYSDKDQDGSYDESDSTVITLSGDRADITGGGTTVSGSTIIISKAGTYILRGTLDNGQILVDTTKADTVRLVLEGADITNKTGSAIYVKQAEKVIITLADGSQNMVSDSASYAENGNVDAAVYAGDDLTFNGSGSLTVRGSYKHAVKTVDDLVIAGGTYDLTASEEALRGKDSISILGGVFTISAGGDAIKSYNSKDAGSGWIAIEGGTFEIQSGNNGIEAAAGILISGGSFNISSERDAVHSNGSIRVAGGSLTLSANDDGMHADNSLDITGGTINITKSYEGLEASDITIRGGMTLIKAIDDGINAAGGSDGDAAPGDRFRASGDYFVSVSGGYTYVYADGDGVDSNGDIYMSGGTLVVDGPESGGSSAMDMETGTYEVSGGTLLAAGSLNMLVTPTNAAQPTVTIIFSNVQKAGTTLALSDSDGNMLLTASPQKAYQCITISSPSFVIGESYSLYFGGTVSGESFDGTYYPQGTYTNSSDTAEFVFRDASIIIGPDGGEAQFTGGATGRMPGGDKPGGGQAP